MPENPSAITREQVAHFVHTESHGQSFAEALTYFPNPEAFHLGPEEYLDHLRRVKQAVDVPVIGSLNGYGLGGWIEYAKLIENGRITRTLKNPNYRGVSSSFWKSLSRVGDGSTWRIFGAPNCGKGEPNQVIFVGHASPVCTFRGVEIFGGES